MSTMLTYTHLPPLEDVLTLIEAQLEGDLMEFYESDDEIGEAHCLIFETAIALRRELLKQGVPLVIALVLTARFRLIFHHFIDTLEDIQLVATEIARGTRCYRSTGRRENGT